MARTVLLGFERVRKIIVLLLNRVGGLGRVFHGWDREENLQGTYASVHIRLGTKSIGSLS